MGEQFSDKIRNTRKLLGLTMQQFAQTLGVSLITLSLIERGKQPSLQFCCKLIKTIGLSFDTRSFSKKAKSKREIVGLSIATLAKATRTAIATIYSIERGDLVSIGVCCKLAKALNIHLKDFINWSDNTDHLTSKTKNR